MEDNSNSNTNQPLLQYLTQELTCSVCMSTFKHPVTIECGHSFCRYCLLNYIRTKNMCPICRTVLHHVTEHPPQDVVLADLVNYLKIRQNAQTSMNLSETNNEKIGRGSQKQIKLQHIQNLLLVDIRCRDILLPYTKVMATFELQSPTLLAKLDRFVARQQNPFNRLGIVSKITYINQLRYNVYECVIQGKAFCEIKNEEIQKKQDQNQQYFYRTCQAEIIYQDYQLNQQIYQNFLHKFIKIKDKVILKDLSKWIDLQQIFSKNNPTATFYSIIRILAETNQNKYKAVTSFNSKTREDFITQFLAKVPSDFQKMPYKFICVKSENGISLEGFFVGLLVFVIVFLLAFNTDYSQI